MIQTMKEIGTTGFAIHPYIKIFAMRKGVLHESEKWEIPKQTVDAIQNTQKTICNTDVIFNAFNVFIISLLLYIIPHRRFNVKIGS